MSDNQTTGQFPNMPGFTTGFEDVVYYSQLVNIVVICQTLGVFGTITNVINMVVFVRMGFRDSINVSLFALTFSDFGTSFMTIFSAMGSNPLFFQLNLPIDYIPVTYLVVAYPRYMFTKITTVITAFIMLERCLCVTMPLKVKTIFTSKRVKIGVSLIYILVIATFIPSYYTDRLAWRFYPGRNKSILSVVYSEAKEKMNPWYLMFITFTYSVVIKISIIVLTIVLVISLNRKARWRQTATNAKVSDEASSKETKIAKMVVIISTLFILCYLPVTVLVLWLSTDLSISLVGSKSYIFYIFASFAGVCESVNASINLFVYYNNSSNYKAAFDKIFRLKQKVKDNCEK